MTEYLPDDHYKGIEHEEPAWDVKVLYGMLIVFSIIGLVMIPFLL